MSVNIIQTLLPAFEKNITNYYLFCANRQGK